MRHLSLLDDILDLLPWAIFGAFLVGVAGCLLIVYLLCLVLRRLPYAGLSQVAWWLEYHTDQLAERLPAPVAANGGN